LCFLRLWYAEFMHFLLHNRTGLIAGFLFGTVGIFLLALLSLMFPLMELIASPFLLPGKMFAAALTGPSASTVMVLFLYFCTGIFYALIGLAVQVVWRMIFKKNTV